MNLPNLTHGLDCQLQIVLCVNFTCVKFRMTKYRSYGFDVTDTLNLLSERMPQLIWTPLDTTPAEHKFTSTMDGSAVTVRRVSNSFPGLEAFAK